MYRSPMPDRPADTPSHAHCTMFDTNIGQCGVAWSPAGLTRVQLPESNAAATEQRLLQFGRMLWKSDLPAEIAAISAMLQRYCAGDREDFRGVTLDVAELSPFDARIYEALRMVTWGTTTSYGALAERIRAPGSAQAVGVAMSRNPWPIIVPCHRVLAASRRIGGFSAHGGAETKFALLELEGVRLREPSLWDE